MASCARRNDRGTSLTVSRFELNRNEYRQSSAARCYDRPVTISGLEASDVKIRLFGDVAIIHARTTYNTADGQTKSGRYTDVWARRNGQWRAVSAHVTRG